MKHIILFSGGAASSYVAYLVKQNLPKEEHKDIVLLNTPTWSEEPDTQRFMCQVARKLKLPVTIWGDGRDIWQLIQDRGAIPGQFMPFCTQRLKQEMKEQYYKYLQNIGEEFIEYVGFGTDEPQRVQKAFARAASIGRTIKFPLVEHNVPKDYPKEFITEKWKIELPSAYKTLKHNNCIPCFKGGQNYFYQVYKNYPDKFHRAMEMEEITGYTVFNGISLKELEEKFKNEKEWESMQMNLSDFIPCECWL